MPLKRQNGWPQYVVIVGCGRLGSLLAGLLSEVGSSVVVIDIEESAFDLLTAGFSGFRIVGDAVEIEVLRAAKTHKADCLLATTEEDNVNLMVAQVARKVFNVPKVLARVFDPRREGVYREFDIETVSPTKLMADAFLASLENRGEE
ncbi:NAD-binding protein [Desulfuromonas sp. CSMB_57]|uniref:NAD-binding protein n=1 Tax=Desulfuromonas sp. CSMB_57 TaxID=2807629 RepID=UPI001CD1E92F|nr:NAD-binding protein [Desulfuromonas sp. CSMB_57]